MNVDNRGKGKQKLKSQENLIDLLALDPQAGAPSKSHFS
jgi:hypothetical protein